MRAILHLNSILFILVFSVNWLNAQSPYADSLRLALDKTEDDSLQIQLSVHLAKVLLEHAPDSALSYIDPLIPLAENLGYREGLLELYHVKGRLLESVSRLQEAIGYFQKARSIAIEISDKKQEAIILHSLGVAYNTLNQKREALNALNEGLRIAQESEFRHEEYLILRKIGQIYSYLTLPDTADIYLRQALAVQEELGDKRAQASVLTIMGNNASRTNMLEKGIEYYEKARKLTREIDYTEGEIAILSNMGYSCMVNGYFPQSLEYYHQAVALAKEYNFSNLTMNNLQAIGEVYLALEDYPQALNFYQQAFDAADENTDNSSKLSLLYRRARASNFNGDYKAAVQYLLQNLELRKQAGYDRHDAGIFLELGTAYENIGQLDSALVHYKSSNTIATKANDLITLSKALTGAGRVYKTLGMLPEAMASLEEGLTVSRKAGYKESEMEISRVLYQLYNIRGQYQNALQNLERYYALRDSMFNEKNIREVSRLEAGFELEQAKQQLAFEQQQETAKQSAFRKLMWLLLGAAVVLILVITRNYLEKQKANKQLHVLNDALIHQKSVVEQQKKRLEELDNAKSRFFTNISHEFRTPLTIISGMIEKVRSEPEVWLEKGSEMIKRNSVNLLTLVNQILDLRKLESKSLPVDMVNGDIVAYLSYITESYHSLAKQKGLELHFLPAMESFMMDYDQDKLLRILSNLLSNAVKFTPPGGHVYVQMSVGQGNGELAEKDSIPFDNILTDREYLILKIRDTGAGIPEDQLDSVFDRFYQVDDSLTRENEGSGIGLALTKELVGLLGGQITLRSAVDKGSEFTVSLPVTRNSDVTDVQFQSLSEVMPKLSDDDNDTEALTDIVSQPVSIDEQSKQAPLVLIVEDNKDVVRFLKACLEEAYQLEVASNGEEGIQKAIMLVPDLIVSDVMMPGKTGFELCDTIKKDLRTSHIPIILLTAKVELESRIAGLEYGADAYLTKPFDPRELQVRLKMLLENRKLLQERYGGLHYLQGQKRPPLKAHEEQFIYKFQKLILKHIDDDAFGIPQICRALSVSRSQIHNKIKALTGKSTSLYIRSIRLEQARHMLLTTDKSVAEIAFNVGFKDPSYFSRVFHEAFGIPPSETRK